MTTNKYAVTVANGNRLLTIHLTASCAESAKRIILNTENCPESAIKSIKDNGSVIK